MLHAWSRAGLWMQLAPVQRICHSTMQTELTDSNSYFGKTSPPLIPRCYGWAWCHMGWSAGVSCSGCVPSQLLAHPQPTCWWVEWETEKFLMLWKHCSETLKHWCAVVFCGHKTEMQHPTGSHEKNQLPYSQTQYSKTAKISVLRVNLVVVFRFNTQLLSLGM